MENVHLLQSPSSTEGKKKHLQTASFLSQIFKAECVMLMLLGQWG